MYSIMRRAAWACKPGEAALPLQSEAGRAGIQARPCVAVFGSWGKEATAASLRLRAVRPSQTSFCASRGLITARHLQPGRGSQQNGGVANGTHSSCALCCRTLLSCERNWPAQRQARSRKVRSSIALQMLKIRGDRGDGTGGTAMVSVTWAIAEPSKRMRRRPVAPMGNQLAAAARAFARPLVPRERNTWAPPLDGPPGRRLAESPAKGREAHARQLPNGDESGGL